jgi:hypothetical protein
MKIATEIGMKDRGMSVEDGVWWRTFVITGRNEW